MNKKVRYISFALILLIIIPIKIYAGRGCCSNHGGEVGCAANGKSICADGTLSPTCTCTPPAIYGCTDSSAKNYNSNANTNDGSCTYYTYGCTDPDAKNYDPNADKSDYSCIYYKKGCTDEKALNYNPEAEKDDNSCKYEQKKDNTGIARKSARSVNNNEEINDNNIDDKKEESDDTGIGVPLLVVTGIGAGAYYEFKKKKKEEKKNILSFFKKEKKKTFIDNFLNK